MWALSGQADGDPHLPGGERHDGETEESFSNFIH